MINVQVAQRLKQMGYSTGCSVGDTIPYIICCEQVCGSGLIFIPKYDARTVVVIVTWCITKVGRIL